MPVTLVGACRRLIPWLCAWALVTATCGGETKTPLPETPLDNETTGPAAPRAAPVEAPPVPA